jgi:integrase
VLRAAFAQAVRWGWLDRNPIERATPPRVHSVETVPRTVVDVLRVLDRAAASGNPENAIVFRIVAATGCRRGEVCALKWSDVDLDADAARVVIRRAVLDLEGRRTLYDTKTHAPRWIRIDDETARMLRAQRDRARELAEAAGVEFSTDDLLFPRSPEAASRCDRTGSVRPGAGCAGRSAWRRACTTCATSRRPSFSTPSRPSPPCPHGWATGTRPQR